MNPASRYSSTVPNTLLSLSELFSATGLLACHHGFWECFLTTNDSETYGLVCLSLRALPWISYPHLPSAPWS
jgi:hypothetical protein